MLFDIKPIRRIRQFFENVLDYPWWKSFLNSVGFIRERDDRAKLFKANYPGTEGLQGFVVMADNGQVKARTTKIAKCDPIVINNPDSSTDLDCQLCVATTSEDLECGIPYTYAIGPENLPTFGSKDGSITVTESHCQNEKSSYWDFKTSFGGKNGLHLDGNNIKMGGTVDEDTIINIAKILTFIAENSCGCTSYLTIDPETCSITIGGNINVAPCETVQNGWIASYQEGKLTWITPPPGSSAGSGLTLVPETNKINLGGTVTQDITTIALTDKFFQILGTGLPDCSLKFSIDGATGQIVAKGSKVFLGTCSNPNKQDWVWHQGNETDGGYYGPALTINSITVDQQPLPTDPGDKGEIRYFLDPFSKISRMYMCVEDNRWVRWGIDSNWTLGN